MRLSEQEAEEVFNLAERLIGSCQNGRFRRDILVSNVERRMRSNHLSKLRDYLALIQSDAAEQREFISALTIHTTSFFREAPHYDQLWATLKEFQTMKMKRPFLLWSAACSTGEELWSAGLVLEIFRSHHSDFDYRIFGSDVDSVSIDVAKGAIYPNSVLDSIPDQFRSALLIGTGRTKGWLTFDSETRKRSSFFVSNLTAPALPEGVEKFDWIFCRNVLIYFDPHAVQKIVESLVGKLNKNGVLCLGHSEALEKAPVGTGSVSSSCYQLGFARNIKALGQSRPKNVANVLVVDDSKVVRKVIVHLLESNGITALEAEGADQAANLIRLRKFDLITLDLSMPGKDGLTWLKEIRSHGIKIPVVIVSDTDPKDAEKTFGALESGAQDYVVKGYLNQNPIEVIERITALIEASKSLPNALGHLASEERLPNKIKFKKNFDVKSAVDQLQPEVILIGASTGGPDAIWTLLRELPTKNCPPIVVVQHINSNFAKPFALRLSSISKLPLGCTDSGEELKPATLYLAFDSYHLSVGRKNGKLVVATSGSEKIEGHRPSVDFLFTGAARNQIKCLSILLTGLGRDGAKGMRELWDAKCSVNIAQSEESCAVYGMPKEAVKLGAVHAMGNISEIRSIIENDLLKLARRVA